MSYPPRRSAASSGSLRSQAPSGQRRPQGGLCPGYWRGPGTASPGCLSTHRPAALGEHCLSPRTPASFRVSPPAAAPGLPTASPGLVPAGPLGGRRSVAVPGCSPAGALCHRRSFRQSPPGPGLSAALPSSPPVLSCTKGFHLLRPLIHTKELRRKVRAESPSSGIYFKKQNTVSACKNVLIFLSCLFFKKNFSFFPYSMTYKN